jgi:Flp pilus assembly protein TadG
MYSRSRILRGVKRFWLRTVVTGERGAELVETAFVLPIFLMCLLGLIWTGRGYVIYEAITRAAREGARYEALPNAAYLGNVPIDAPSSACLDTSTSTFQSYIAPVLQATNLDPSKVTGYCQKTQWLNTGDDPQQCGVVISFTYPAVMEIPFTSLHMTTINIKTQVQMRNENQPVSISGAAPTCP